MRAPYFLLTNEAHCAIFGLAHDDVEAFAQSIRRATAAAVSDGACLRVSNASKRVPWDRVGFSVEAL